MYIIYNYRNIQIHNYEAYHVSLAPLKTRHFLSHPRRNLHGSRPGTDQQKPRQLRRPWTHQLPAAHQETSQAVDQQT
jgi:hypothetical protein